MELFEFELWQFLDILLLLLIGMGLKVALVPFLDLTAVMDRETKKKVASRMVRTATVVALLLLVLGTFLDEAAALHRTSAVHRRWHRISAGGPAYAGRGR
jgi:hypothetical protein